MKNLIKVVFILFLLWTTGYGLWTANAAVPHLINYQGRLTDSSGNPLNGSYSLTFRIYDAETAGNLLWEEAQSGVIIQKGTFTILLGSVINLGLPFDKPYFLEIKVGNEVMTPRQIITSAGYAIRAEKAEQATNADTVSNVSISTTPAPNKILPLDNNGKLPVTALKIYDSGWFSVTKGTAYLKTHNLGTTKCLVHVYLAQNADGSGLFGDNGIGADPQNNMHTLKLYALSTTQIGLRANNLTYVANFTDANGTPTYLANAYCRIVMLALE